MSRTLRAAGRVQPDGTLRHVRLGFCRACDGVRILHDVMTWPPEFADAAGTLLETGQCQKCGSTVAAFPIVDGEPGPAA